MLESLKGKVLEAEEDRAVLDVNGLRFELMIPSSTFSKLPAIGEEAALLTRLTFNMNEGTFNLFGFGTPEERSCYDIFTRLSGIGPRKGMMILSQIDIANFASAVVRNDVASVSKIKGIGKKTAERLVVELREKMTAFVGVQPVDQQPSDGANAQDAMQALMALGAPMAVADKAIRRAVEELGRDAKTEDLVKAGLRHRY